ncbi:MAG TPA: CRTAC1 family protein [Thermoanaerobaculia bacterium]|nr:CRTAC1 family protein [Thermoanaerobaculia bacterium]
MTEADQERRPRAGSEGDPRAGAAAVEPPSPDHDEDWVPEDDAVIGRAFRVSLLVLAAAGVAVAVGLGVVRLFGEDPLDRAIAANAPARVSRTAEPPAVPFTDTTAEWGIAFVHHNGAYGEKLLPETMGGGVAIFDFDGDGDQDLFFVDSTRWPEGPATAPAGALALYENDGAGRFRDVTQNRGLDIEIYGTGVAVGDYDNDGDVDIFVAAVGRNLLLRNEDSGRWFTDVTAEAGVGGDPAEWSSSSAFLDYDRDGDLDLLVGNYVRWSREIDLELDYRLTGVGRAYGPPLNYEGTFPYLYRNDGGGRFTDVSAEAGVQVTNEATGGPVAKTLGAVPVDANRDGWIDFYLANDTVRNFLFVNRQDGTFEEVGELYGLAYGPDGVATGAMGTDWAFYRNDDETAFLVANFANEMSSFYVSQGDPTLYTDEAITAGIGAPSRRLLSFGVFFFDYDLDGRLDVLQANGHLEEEISTVDPSQTYRQPVQLFWNAGEGALVPVAAGSLGDLAQPLVARAAAYGDLDGDGDLDVVIAQAGERAVVYRNDQSEGHHWLRVKLVGNGTTVNRDAIGATVELKLGGETLRRAVVPSRSYQAQVELPVTFGLGDAETVESIEVLWPDGTSSRHPVGAVDRLIAVEQPALE